MLNISLTGVYTEEPFEHLGLESIATYLRQYGYNINLNILSTSMNIDEAYSKIGRTCHFYGFSLSYTNAKFVYSLCEKIKIDNNESIIFVGGQFATLCSAEILDDCPFIDFIILGDGELTLKDLCDYYSEKKVIKDSIHVFRREDFNSSAKIPMLLDEKNFIQISHTLLDDKILKNVYAARIYTARGCCASCSFCAHDCYSKANDKKWRGRNIEDVFNEIVSIYKQYNKRIFMISDSSFEDPGELGKARINKLCDMLLAYPVKFSLTCFFRAESFKEKDKWLLQKMKKAGFNMVYIGIESLDKNDLSFFNKRATPKDNYECIKLFKECNIDVFPGFIMLNPISTKYSLRINYNFLIDTKQYLPFIYKSKLFVYKGTVIEKKTRELGLLKSSYSYLDPEEYDFQDEYVRELDRFITKELSNLEFNSLELDFINYEQLFKHIISLYSEETEDIKDIFDETKSEMYNLLAAYYKHLYVDYKIDNALKDKCDFTNQMLNVLKRYKVKKFSTFKHPVINAFITKNMSRLNY